MNHTKEPWKAVTGGRCDPEVIITTQDRIDNHKGEICGMGAILKVEVLP